MLNCYTPRKVSEAKANSHQTDQERGQDSRSPRSDKVNGAGTQSMMDVLDVKRSDGRGPHDMRQVYMDVGVVAHATGSAYVEFNHTKVICAVHGPHAQSGRDTSFNEQGKIQCEYSYAPFATRGLRREGKGGKGDDERELSTLLRQTLEASVQVHRLTKSVVDVHVMVLQADGGELAVATICASMALADAGIELYDLVTACSVGYSGTQMVLDPTRDEEVDGGGVVVIAIMPGSQQVTQWWQDGRFEGHDVEEALELCTDGCGSIQKLMEARLKISRTKSSDGME